MPLRCRDPRRLLGVSVYLTLDPSHDACCQFRCLARLFAAHRFRRRRMPGGNCIARQGCGPLHHLLGVKSQNLWRDTLIIRQTCNGEVSFGSANHSTVSSLIARSRSARMKDLSFPQRGAHHRAYQIAVALCGASAHHDDIDGNCEVSQRTIDARCLGPRRVDIITPHSV
jgi:hypothetical protein